MVDIKDGIIWQLSKVIKHLGGKSDILAITGSYGDTQTDEEILEMLRFWNDLESIKKNPMPSCYSCSAFRRTNENETNYPTECTRTGLGRLTGKGIPDFCPLKQKKPSSS